MTVWKKVALKLEKDYGIFVDWDERFFICPECNETIYECDFNKDSVLVLGYCPICGAALTEECEYENFYEHEEEEYDEDEDEMMYARYDEVGNNEN